MAAPSARHVLCEPGLPPRLVSRPIPADAELRAMSFPFRLDDFQRIALGALEARESVLVAAHTSAGKTAVALYAVALGLARGQRVVYTSPIKALSNQKYRELREAFGDNVGLMTGDVTLSPAADALPLALGGCHALCVTFDAQLARGLVSFRRRDANAPLERGAVHALFARDGTQVGAVGGSTARLALARSALLVDGALRPLVAAGDEATCRPILWSVRGSRVVQELEAHAQPVVDIAQLPRSSVFATCSASRLDLYRLSASAGD